jgi:dehydrogenase/reductase SDR family member 4
MKGIEGKVALVTGASRGIGEAVARKLAAEGAKVALSSRKIEALQGVADAIAADGGTAIAHAAHNGRVEDLLALADAVEEQLGPIDILVNNAGTNPVFGPAIQADERLWDSLFATNVKGHFFLSQRVAKGMVERGGGAIVNVASVAAKAHMFGLGLYGVTKAALTMMSTVLAKELGPAGVRVNTVGPGVIDTKFSTMLVNTPEIREKVLEQQALKRIGEVDDVADAVAFLCSDAARHVTGHFLTVDGGMLTY